nr:uncharacterized protein LOC112278471 isoform X4 [Physcomitrium patens]|eukprot:XP_024367787.1 uncharacterized protein LOC112278471 isoform X4 [Physcomitrella patens]
MRFADSDYGSDDPGNSDISDDVHYEASLLNRSSDYTRPRPRGAQEKGNVSENLTQSSSQLKTCVEHKNAFSSVSRSGKPIYE